MFRVKICGVTNVEDARAVAAAGADAVGLNFFSGSPRCVADSMSMEIANAVRAQIHLVGVFVNHPPETIHATARKLTLDYVQLHGDEPLEMLGDLVDLKVIRAFRCGPDGLAYAAEFLERARDRGLALSAALIDAHDPQRYGGTGRTADWNAVRDIQGRFAGLPIVLAGGLRPDNVAEAISAVRPAAVDTASGVELPDGRKSPAQIAQFVSSANTAFTKVEHE